MANKESKKPYRALQQKRTKAPVKKLTQSKSSTHQKQKYQKAKGSQNKRFQGAKNVAPSKKSVAQKIGAEQIEGRRAVLELLIAGNRKTYEIYFLADLKPSPILDDIKTIAESEGVKTQTISKAKFFQIAKTETPQGVIAKASVLKPVELESLLTNQDSSKTSNRVSGGTPPFLLVLDGIVDTANLGSLIRSAECAGATGLVMSRHRSASITAATAKAASGAIEYLPMAVVSGIPQTLETLKSHNVWTVGLDQNADSSIYDIKFANEPIALVIGAEGEGLKNLTKKRVDTLASIPLHGRISALNAAVASAVACFEIQRLRESSK